MEKGKHEKKKVKLLEKYTVLLLIATIFISIGYANIIDQELIITGLSAANAQDGVFITDVVYALDTSADTESSKINYFTETMMESNVVLGGSGSSITYAVTVYNSTDREQLFIKAITDKTDPLQYSNTNIGYSVASIGDLTGLEEYVTTIAPNSYLTFPVTFSYTGTNTSNNTLLSKLNFRFREKPIIELSNENTTYTLQNIKVGHVEEYEFTVSNYNQNYTNRIPMTYTLGTTLTEGSPLIAKIYNSSGTEVTENIEIAGDGSNVDHTYTLKLTWDSSLTDTEYEGKSYTCKVNLVATPTDTDYAEYEIAKEFGVNIKTCAHNYVKPAQSGTKFTTTGDYSDGTNTAKIPAGFTVSGVGKVCTICGAKTATQENKIEEGLVIYLIDDKTETEIANINWDEPDTLLDLKKTYDQFVWIPIPRENINDMYMCQSEDGTKSCKITVQDIAGEEVAYCTTHNSTAMAGRLYATSIGNNYNASLTTQKYTSGSGLREPDTVSSSDGTTNYLDQLNGILSTSYGAASDFKTDLQDEYNEIVKSVYQNQGFYVGRYETSGMKNTNTNATVKIVAGSDNTTNSNISIVTWYRMYAEQKKYAENKGLTSSIGSTMIQGAAYDQVMKFVDPTTSFVKTTGRVSHDLSAVYQTGGLDYVGTVTYNDVAKNIYDLEGNVYAYTTEASNTDVRVFRGGRYNYNYSPSYRYILAPHVGSTGTGSVCQLYIHTSHTYGNWGITKEATCAEVGSKIRTCGCGATETDTIALLEHNYSNGECTICGEACTHTWGAWIITKVATCTEAGIQTRTCSVCGSTETQTIQVTGHSYELPERTGQRYSTSVEYSDGTKVAVIPAGFTVSGVTPSVCTICGKSTTLDECTIDDGLVIYLIDDKTDEEIEAIDWMNETIVANLQKTYDQFVWIPIPRENINNMYMCQSEDGTKSCNITERKIEGEYVPYCTTHSSTAMAGRLYAEAVGEVFNPSLTTQTYTSGSGLREPDVLASANYDGSTENLDQLNSILGTSYSTASSLLTDLQSEYNGIVKSIYENEGFYIGRYETSGMKDSATNATVKIVAGSDDSTNAKIREVTWYRMYAQQKMYAANRGIEEIIGSTMIQGAAYDQVMKFIDPTTSFVTTTGRVGHGSSDFKNTIYKTGGLNYSTEYKGTVTYNDVAKNIYDLEGNVGTFTTEASTGSYRVHRAGSTYSARSPSYRSGDVPYSSFGYMGSVCQLYILPCNHNCEDWTVTQVASCTEIGTNVGICTICNVTLTEEISATGHSYKDGKCSTCGLTCSHNWSAKDGICATCGLTCSHNWSANDGICATCSYECTHGGASTGTCSTCGKTLSCIVEGTLITLANGKQVAVEDLTGNETLLVWNLETGTYDEAEIAYIIDHGGVSAERDIIHLYFSDGTDIETIKDHGFYDLDLNKLMYIDADNYEEFIGHWFVTQKLGSENEWNKVQLIDVKLEKRTTVAYEVVTFGHLTCYTNGLLSISSLLNPFCNTFEVDEETLSYNKAQMAKDIEIYGLFTYEDFEGRIPEYAFRLYHVEYLKVALGKGLTTWEEIEYLIQFYNEEIDPIVMEKHKTENASILNLLDSVTKMFQ